MSPAGHKLLPVGAQMPAKSWRCECGGWTGDVPSVGGWGRTSLRARMAQLMMGHARHVKHAVAKAARSPA